MSPADRNDGNESVARQLSIEQEDIAPFIKHIALTLGISSDMATKTTQLLFQHTTISPIRWTPIRKAILIMALYQNILTMADLSAWFNISAEEFRSWECNFKKDGIPGLRNTRLHAYAPQRRFFVRTRGSFITRS